MYVFRVGFSAEAVARFVAEKTSLQVVLHMHSVDNSNFFSYHIRK